MNDTQTLQRRQGHRLLRFGMALFLLGLVTGLLLPAMANPRMGLSSHLEGIMNGMVLVLFGLLWPRLKLGARASRAGFALALFGTYINWGTTLVAGFAGAGEKMMPIAGAGHRGTDTAEMLIAIALVALVPAMLAASGIVLWGLRGAFDRGNES